MLNEIITPIKVVAAVVSKLSGTNPVSEAISDAGKNPHIDAADFSKSLVEYTQGTRVEPLVLVEKGLQNEKITSDLLHTLSNLFMGYYLQAVASMTTIGSVNVLKKLDKLNPNRSIFSLEEVSDHSSDYGLEAVTPAVEAPNKANKHASIKELNQDASLAVGKMLEVTFNHEGTEYKMPISLRLTAITATTSLIQKVFSLGSYQNTFGERWHRWKAGELEMVKDLIFCQDLVKAHRSALAQDETGFYKEAVRRRRNNKIIGAIGAARSESTKSLSVGTASNMLVISAATALKIQNEIGGKLSDYKIREDMMDVGSLMFLVIVDSDYERVTIYHQSIKQGSDLSFRDVKSNAKDKGADVLEILKAFQASTVPVI